MTHNARETDLPPTYRGYMSVSANGISLIDSNTQVPTLISCSPSATTSGDVYVYAPAKPPISVLALEERIAALEATVRRYETYYAQVEHERKAATFTSPFSITFDYSGWVCSAESTAHVDSPSDCADAYTYAMELVHG